MMISIEALTEKFGPALDVPKLGKCIAVPGDKFNPDWEAELDDQGYKVFFETWDNHPMTVIPLEKINDNLKIKQVKNMDKAKLWSKSEDDLLVSLWVQVPQLRVSKIASWFKQKFPLRSASGVANRIQQLQQKENRIKPRFIYKASKEAERSPTPKVDSCLKNTPGTLDKRLDSVKVEPAVAEPKPKWNGEFAENCNFPPDDCMDCDITECPGRKSERRLKVDGADVLINLVKEVTVLRESYDSLNKAYVELQTKIKDFENWKEDVCDLKVEVKVNDKIIAELAKDLARHKHDVFSGKAMIPLEAS